MRIKGILAKVFLIALAFTYVLPANAMMGGQDATGDDRVVAIIHWSENAQRGCSGALIAPRVVFTAAHCLSRKPTDGKYPSYNTELPKSGVLTETDAPIWVSSPGIVIPIGGTLNKVKAIAQYVSPLYQDSGCDDGDKAKCHGSRYDFGILILEKTLGTKTFKFATTDEISDLYLAGSTVLSIGYGLTSYAESQGEARNENPNKASAVIRKSYIWQGGDELVKPFPKNMIVQTRMPIDTYLGGGDSGSPLWFEKDGQWIYIGALSGAQGPTPASSPSDPLWKDTFWGTNGTGGPGGQYSAAQAFPEVIQVANKFLADQIILEGKAAAELKAKQEAEAKAAAELKAKQEAEAKAAELKAKQEAEAMAAADLKAKQEADAKATVLKKTTITCLKGKLVKKVTAVKPVCPKGYKKK